MAEKTAGILGIEGGGTKTTWALISREGKTLAQGAAGPGNTLLLSDAALGKLAATIRKSAGTQVEAIGGAFAGCQQAAEKARVEKALRRVWPKAGVVRVMEDTRSALAAGFGAGPGQSLSSPARAQMWPGRNRRTIRSRKRAAGAISSPTAAAPTISRGADWKRSTPTTTRRKRAPRSRRNISPRAGKTSLEELVPYLLKDTAKTTVAQWAALRFPRRRKREIAPR